MTRPFFEWACSLYVYVQFYEVTNYTRSIIRFFYAHPDQQSLGFASALKNSRKSNIKITISQKEITFV